MTSLESAAKKRCVQKLDFENCIVTNIKTRSRIRKKLRARITREIERIGERQACEASQDVSPLRRQNTPEATSPVLIKTQSRCDKSPVFFKRKKLTTKEEDLENFGESQNATFSPVFKLKVGKCFSQDKSQDLERTLERITSFGLSSEGNSSSCCRSSCKIEDFTQESMKSVKISSIESTGVKSKSSGDYSVDCKNDSSKIWNISWDQAGSDPMGKWLEAKELNDSLRNVRKNGKKNSLLGRLQKLLQKQASEKLLWQHQSRGNPTSSLKLVAVGFWSDEYKFILKCWSDTESEITFLIVDRKWVPNVKKVKEGSVIELHPPWQKIVIQKPMLTIFLNVICLDVLEEVEDTPVKNLKVELIPIGEFENDPRLFVNSLFSFPFTELLL